MVHFSLPPETMDKLAAAAVLNGRSISDEIRTRVERSLMSAKPSEAENDR